MLVQAKLNKGGPPDLVWLLSTATARAAIKAREEKALVDRLPIVGSALSSLDR